MTLTIAIKGGTPRSDADKCRNCTYAMRVVTVDSEEITYCRSLDNSIVRTKLAECSSWEEREFKSMGPPAYLTRNKKDEIVWTDGWGRQIRPEPPKRRKRRIGLNGPSLTVGSAMPAEAVAEGKSEESK